MTCKTGLRKTDEAGSRRNFSYWKNYRLQSCVFTARWMLVFTLKLYLQKQQGFCMGRTELPGDREELPPLSVVLHWSDFFGGVLQTGVMTTEADLEEGLKACRKNLNGGQVLSVKRWQGAHLDLSLQSSGWELTSWFSLLGEITILWRISKGYFCTALCPNTLWHGIENYLTIQLIKNVI